MRGLRLADGTSPDEQRANAQAVALVNANSDVLEAFGELALESGQTEAMGALLCLEIESWSWLAEALMPRSRLDMLVESARLTGGTAMACGYQRWERLESLFFDRYGLGLAELRPPCPPGQWCVLACFKSGLAILTRATPAARAAAARGAS